MNLPKSLIEPLFERVEAYAETTLELSKLKAVRTGISVTTALLSGLGVALFLLLSALVFSIGMAIYLGDLLGKPCYGYFVMAGFYLLVGLVLRLFLPNFLRKPVSDFVIKHAFQPTESWKK